MLVVALRCAWVVILLLSPMLRILLLLVCHDVENAPVVETANPFTLHTMCSRNWLCAARHQRTVCNGCTWRWGVKRR
jgi:hypothetical protein